MIQKILYLINPIKKFWFIIFLNLLTFFFEFFTLISIPIFLILLSDKDFFFKKISNTFLEKYLLNFNNNEIAINISLIVIFLFLLKNIFILFLNYYQGIFLRNIKLNLTDKLFNSFVNLPYSFHLNSNPEKLSVSILQNVQGFYIYILHSVLLIRESLAIFVIFILLTIINPILTLGVCIFLGLATFFYIKIIKSFIKLKANQNNEISKNINKVINETFGAIKDIKILLKEKEVENYFKKFTSLYEKNIFFINFFDKLPRIFLEFFSIIIVILISLIFFELESNKTFLFANLALLAVSVMRFIPAFNGFILSFYYMKVHQPSVNSIFNELKNIEKYQDEEFKKVLNSKTNKDIDAALIIENIKFSYPSSTFYPLNGVSMNIKNGAVVGITGRSGSGKTTLFNLMLGLLKPSSGNIFYNGESIYNDISKWRSKIGYISQNIYILDGSIKKNITFNFLDEHINSIDDENLQKAISISRLDNKISKLKQGIETSVGNNGLLLSGGERQRIALARAIYRDPEIFLLDEYTSAIDEITEDEIMNNIKKYLKNKTIILISHKKTTLDRCDIIYQLNNGVFT
jgi:ABC-type bacteriocin/lantibiotic exporter with double-glycine peptidase domain